MGENCKFVPAVGTEVAQQSTDTGIGSECSEEPSTMLWREMSREGRRMQFLPENQDREGRWSSSVYLPIHLLLA